MGRGSDVDTDRAQRPGRRVPVVLFGVLMLGLAGGLPAAADVWVDQVGLDIDGEAAGDSAHAVAMSADGDRVAVGAPGNDGNGESAGHVRVFDWDGIGWSQVGADIDGAAAGDASGWEVALSADGDRVAIGAPGNDGNGVDAGHVRIYDWNGVGWSQVGASIAGRTAGDRSGSWVALSADGDRVAIGATGDWRAARPGYVRVFDWDGVGWSQVGAGISTARALDWRDSDLALSAVGDRWAFGSNDVGAQIEGRVQVFDWDGARWVQTGDDIVVDPEHANFGNSVALSGSADRLAVGAHGDWDVGPPGGVWVLDLVEGDWVIVDEREGKPVESVALSADGRRVVYSGSSYLDGEIGHTFVRDFDGVGWADVADIPADDLGDAAELVALSAVGDRLAIGSRHNHGTGNYTGTFAGQVRVLDLASTPHPPRPAPVSVVPARLLDTRPDNTTVDGISAAIGRRSAGSVTSVQVTGRGGVPEEASAVFVNVAAVLADGPGHLTTYPCGAARPETSSLNYGAGAVVSGSVLTRVGEDGEVCVYTHAAVDLVIDVTGYTVVRSGLRSIIPAREMDTRTGRVETAYEEWVEIDRVAARSVTEVWMTSRGGVPWGVSAVMLNVAAVLPDGPGYLTVYPCESERPLASSLNYAAGDVVSNAVFTGVSAWGRVCIYSHAAVDLVADVTGYTPVPEGLRSLQPARLLETRPGNETVDGVAEAIGRRAAGSVIEVMVTGRGGVPEGAAAVMLNVAAVLPYGPGHLTVYPCDAPRPVAASLNHASGDVISNSVFTRVGENGTVCIYTHAETDLVVDVTGHT